MQRNERNKELDQFSALLYSLPCNPVPEELIAIVSDPLRGPFVTPGRLPAGAEPPKPSSLRHVRQPLTRLEFRHDAGIIGKTGRELNILAIFMLRHDAGIFGPSRPGPPLPSTSAESRHDAGNSKKMRRRTPPQ